MPNISTGLSSTCLSFMDWNQFDQSLTLNFVNGGTYTYHNVPERIARALLAAPSHGSFFYHNIRDAYSFSRG